MLYNISLWLILYLKAWISFPLTHIAPPTFTSEGTGFDFPRQQHFPQIAKRFYQHLIHINGPGNWTMADYCRYHSRHTHGAALGEAGTPRGSPVLPPSYLPCPPTPTLDSPHRPRPLKVQVPSKVKVFSLFKKSKSLKISWSINTFKQFYNQIKKKVCTTGVKNKFFPKYDPVNSPVPWETVEGNGILSSTICSSWFEVKWLSENGRQLWGLESFGFCLFSFFLPALGGISVPQPEIKLMHGVLTTGSRGRCLGPGLQNPEYRSNQPGLWHRPLLQAPDASR